MKLEEASTKFESLLSSTDNKYEIRVYKKFILALTDLKSKDLSGEQFLMIETELDTLEINSVPENKKKHYRKGLNKFMKFLNDELSLITEGYYTGIGMVLGMSFGVALGTSLFNASGSSMGIGLGMIIGMLIGAAIDSKAKKENRVIRTSISK
jgi:hypothetical protein